MIASTTQSTQRRSPIERILYRSPSKFGPKEFNDYIQQEYGACWGTLKFEDYYSNETRPFLYVNGSIDLNALRRFMMNEWKLKPANIVIPILSGVTNNKPFKNLKMIKTLKNGITNAVNASDVWFITNGLDAGLPKLIGDAFRDEISMRRADDEWTKRMKRALIQRKTLILLGIVCDDEIKDILDLNTATDKSKMDVKVRPRKFDKVPLNSDHTHFIIIREPTTIDSNSNTTDEKQLERLTDSAESATNRFRDRFEDFLHQQTVQLIGASPMVCTLVRGTLGTIELLYRKIQQDIPSVILKGTGSAADIIAFAYEEMSAKSVEEYDDSYLRVALAQRLREEYSILKDDNIKLNEILDHLIYIVQKSKQGKQKFLTFVDVNSTTTSLNDFHKYILSALLQSQKTFTKDKINDQWKKNLRLTLDWNLPDLASSEFFQRDDNMKCTIPETLFHKAVLGKKLEPFVDLFLDQDFFLHQYLNSGALMRLFNEAEAEDREFLTTTSLEGILGLTENEQEVPKDFVEHGLNIIVKRLTGICYFFNSYEMDCYLRGFYFGKESDKRIELRKHAEKKALQYLIIYAVLMNRHQLAMILWKRSTEPIQMALICYVMFKNLAPHRHGSDERLSIEKQAKAFSDCAIGVLNKSVNEDSLRALAMLDEKYPDWNDMTIVELAYFTENKEFMAQAVCQKWISRQFYGGIALKSFFGGLFTCSDYCKIIASACLIFPMWFWIDFPQIDQTSPINFIKKIKILWSAPITKFCMTFVAYLAYLSFFTLAVLWPSCGNLFLDCFVWFWAASILCENARVTFNKYRSRSVLRVRRALIEIVLQIIFLALYLGIRIIGLWWFGICQILTAKAILGIGLIYYYIRIVYIFLPISSRFGPWMIRLQHMIMDDFVTFLQLFAIFLISSGAAITAVLYPHHPLDMDMLSKAFIFRGLMVLFSSEMTDFKRQNRPCSINATDKIDGEYSCLRLAQGRSFKYDNLNAYNSYGISSTYCNQTSWIAWFLLIQYFFLAKRFLISLLTAMFSVTGARLQSQSEQMLIYYQYEIVMEYAKRTCLPPPFVFISHIGMLISNIIRRCVMKLKKHSDERNNSQQRQPPSIILSCKPCQKIIERERDKKEREIQNLEVNEADRYWKYKAEEYYVKAQETNEVQEKRNPIENGMINDKKDMDVLQNSLRQINERIFSLKTLIESHVPIHQKFIHILSRESPYIFTNEVRFPVTEKYISWTVQYDLYDPTLITLSKEHICFHNDERPFVESELLAEDQCRNPIGRTGVHGRGALIRWGPNKCTMAIITRWKRHHGQFVIIDGQRILEAMVFKDKITNDWKLPVGNILGVESSYSALCRSFNKLAFQENDPKLTSSLQEQEMIEYFESYSCDDDNNERTAGFKSYAVYNGYIDDVRNTDNAWVEAEVWNFHYDINMSFIPRLRNDGMVLWKDITSNFLGFLIQPSILREITRIHNGYYE